jgi:AAHS family 4-hydroxybenzoate transporter-like MFS transporter
VVLDGFNNQIIGFALPAILKDWGLPRAEFAPVVSGGLVGMAVGTFLGGLGGDRWGRKPSLIASVLLFGAASGLTSLAHNPLEIGVLRFISGMGIGGALPNAATLAAEFTPARKRAMAVTCTIVCVPLGGLAGGLLAAQVLPSLGWRAFYVMAGAAPLVIALILWLLLPESPSFLARRPGRAEELSRFLRRCGVTGEEELRLTVRAPVQAGGRKRGLRALFEPFYARDTAALWLVFFSSQAGVYLVFTWLPTLLADRGFGLNITSMGLMANNLGGVIGALVGARAIEAFGSRRAMTALALGAAAVAAILYGLPIAPGRGLVGLIVLLTAHGFFLNGVQTTVYALTAHVYLADVRATGSGTALAVGRAGGILSAFAGAALLADAGRPFFIALAAVMALAAVGLLMVRRHIPPLDAA